MGGAESDRGGHLVLGMPTYPFDSLLSQCRHPRSALHSQHAFSCLNSQLLKHLCEVAAVLDASFVALHQQ